MMARTPLPGTASPTAGFDEPFAMLGACHDRVRRSLELLQRLLAHRRAHGSDDSARQAAADVLRYFQLAAPAHHEDEELHVVPVLRASGDARDAAAAAQIVADHVAIRAAWSALEPLLEQVAAGAEPDATQLQAAADAFVAVHGDHLRLEDEAAFPRAAAELGRRGAAALQAMGDEMARRRGAKR